jgi:hypothetical protein
VPGKDKDHAMNSISPGSASDDSDEQVNTSDEEL